MKFITFLSAALIALSSFIPPAVAQQPRRVTLDQAVMTALEYNRTVAAARQQVEASDWGVRKAYTEYLPKVSINQRLTRVDDFSVRQANFAIDGLKSMPGMEDIDIPPFLFKDTHATSIAVTQPVYTGGLLSSGLESAKITQENDRLSVRESEAEIVLQATRAYLDLARNIEFTRVREESLELARENLKNVTAKNELGLRPRSDILRWEAQVATEESNLIETENAVSIARINLANVMGIDLDESIAIEPVTGSELQQRIMKYAVMTGSEPAENVQKLCRDAVNNNPGRKMISLQKSLTETTVKTVRSGFFPQLSLSYNYSWQPNDTPGLDGFKKWDISLNMSYSLFKGFGDVADLQKARAEVKQIEIQEQDYDRGLRVSVFTAYNNIRTSLAKITLYEKNLVQARDNLALVQSRYDLGLASNIDLIDAQVLETTARVNLISSRYDLLIAGAELDRLVGRAVAANQ